MIGSAAFCPVFSNQPHVQIPALTGRPTGFDGGECPVAHRKWRQAGRAAQAFLSAAIADVDADSIDAHIAALTATGGLMLVGIALRLLRIREVPVGDLLPALVVAPLLTQLVIALS